MSNEQAAITGEAVAKSITTNDVFKRNLSKGVNAIVEIAHGLAYNSGWWDIPEPVLLAKKSLDLYHKGEISLPTCALTALRQQSEWAPNIAEKLCLIHSEVSEAMEGDRKNLMDDKLPHRKMIEVELADVLIRVADLSGYLGLDLGGAVVEKLAFNQGREDHKRENRAKDDGKKY